MSEHSKSKDDLERALALAKKAHTAYPENAVVLDSLGWIYYKEGDLSLASDYIGKAQFKTPESAVINYHMGMVFHRLSKFVEAKVMLQKSVAGKDDYYGKDEAVKILEKCGDP